MAIYCYYLSYRLGDFLCYDIQISVEYIYKGYLNLPDLRIMEVYCINGGM